MNAKTDLINQNLEIATLRAANTGLKLKGTSREVQLDIAKTEIGNLKEHVTYLTDRLNEVKTDLTGSLEKVKIEELGRSLSNAQKQNLVLKRLIFGVAAVAGGFFAYLGVKRA